MLLGQGADGGVRRGFHLQSGASHALKYVSRKAYCVGELRELAVLQEFQKHLHPNALTLLAAFAPSGERPQWVLATPEADCNLRTFMWKHQSQVRTIARSMGCQMLEGLGHIHYHRVLHRDLKPDNILVFFDLSSPAPLQENEVCGWAVRLQLADFSRARKLPDDTGAVRCRLREKTIVRPTVGLMSTMICTRN